MTPAPPGRRRLSILAWLCLAGAALALSACGGGGSSATATTTVASSPGPQAPAPTAGPSCPGQVAGFVRSMASLRSNLAVGLSYEQYAGQLRRVRSAYAGIPVAKLTLDCLTATGSPAERALNQYTEAANSWGECLAEAGCDTASIEARLQARWRVASHFLSAAR